MKINKKEILQQQEYNRLYEVLDQDTQWGVEYIMNLEGKLNDLNGCDKYAKQLENDIKSLKRTIADYKLEITYYRNTIKTAETNLDVEICDWEFEDKN
jgi:hypothetical protein